MIHPTHVFKCAALSLAVLASACGPASSNSDAATNSDGSSADAATNSDGASASAVYGTFKLQIVLPMDPTPGNTTIVGRLQDGENPSTTQWTQAMTSGDCKLLTPSIPSCTPACGSSAACVGTNNCQRYPTAIAGGEATITGLRASGGASGAITLTSVANNYQLPAGTALMYPAFAEGDALAINIAAAGSVPAISLSNAGIAPINLTVSNLMVAQNTAVNLTWTAPTMTSAQQRIRVKLDISHHGGTRGKIECDTDDDGSLEIAAPLVTALVNLGVAGFPSIVVSRERITSATVNGGTVNFAIVSDTEQYVTVPGVRSCTEDADCMGTGTCQEDLTCG